MKRPLMQAVLVCFTVMMSQLAGTMRPPLEQPNIIIFLADDFGYGDLSSYGHPTQEFGPIDQMGREGMRFTQWYAPALFCSPSRGAMLTGRYPVRIGLYGERQQPFPVFTPESSTGLPKEELTVAEMLKDLGYATGMVGKWHLGVNGFNASDGNHLPKHHGFDYVGTIMPYTNVWRCDQTKTMIQSPDGSFCVLYYGDTVLQQPLSHHNLTTALLLDAKAFVYDHQHEPFFFYFSFPHTHSNLFSGEAFKNSSRRGLYGDNVNEMSWAVGEMLQLLRDMSLERNTLAIFLSDHGPEREMCKEGGVSSPLKGVKGTTYEGGVRVPAIAWWPGTIPADVTNHEVISSMDLFSLALDLAGGTLPTDRIIDGRSIKEVLLKRGPAPNRALFHYCGTRIMAVRHGKYKVHYHTQELHTDQSLQAFCGPTGIPDIKGDFHCGECYDSPCVTSHDPPLLFDLDEDPEESYPLPAREHEALLREVARLVSEHEAGMVHGIPLFNDEFFSSSVKVCCNPPYCIC